MLTRIVSLLVLSVFFLGLPVVGQAPSPAAEPTPVIHATTREVLLDFVARDKHHRAISDLHPQEVEVYEDGVLQTVKSFRNIEGAEQLQLEREAAQNQAPTTDSGDVQNAAKGASPAPTLNLSLIHISRGRGCPRRPAHSSTSFSPRRRRNCWRLMAAASAAC